MKITFQGFRLYSGNGITLPEFAEILAQASSADTEYKFNEHHRLFLFEKDSNEEFYTGLLITAKDQKTFPELRNEKGKISIKVSELAAGSRLMDFNFFVLHKITFCGVYQHYHASCSPAQFGVFLRYFFWKPERDARIEAKKAELVQNGIPAEKAEEKAKKAFNRSLKFDLFYKPEDFEKILQTMKEIKRFEFDVSTKVAKQKIFSPGVELKKVQERVAFANAALIDKISGAVSGFVKNNKIERGKVIAIDPTGEQRSVYLTKNVEGFGEFDFDAVTAELEIEDLASEFSTSPVIKNLISAAKDNNTLFCEPDD